MSLIPEQIAILRGFLKSSDFNRGAVVLDLDGTVLHEIDNKIFISGSVEMGVKEIRKLGRPVILNTLRFPLSVIKKVSEEWMKMAASEIPVVLLNGSILGMICRDGDKAVFNEIAAYPIEKEQLLTIVDEVKVLVDNDMRRIDLFYYPRNWQKGEIIWVPEMTRVEYVKKKYLSACEVISVDLDELKERLLSEDVCMVSVLVDHPRDHLMAYQHQNPSDHMTRTGVNKSFGLRELARKMNISLMDSVGGGDTRMDNFLNDTGLSVIVGEDNDLQFRGRRNTLWVREPSELGDILVSLAQSVSEMNSNKYENH